MSYKYSKGSQVIGDLKAADDTERNTLIDFGEDQINFETSGSGRLQISNNGVGGAYATAVITIADNPTNGGTLSFGDSTITPVVVSTYNTRGTGDDIVIGASAAATRTNTKTKLESLHNVSITIDGDDLLITNNNFGSVGNRTISETFTSANNSVSGFVGGITTNISASAVCFADSVKILGATPGEDTVIDNQGNFYGNSISVGTVSGSNIVVTDGGGGVEYQLPITDGSSSQVMKTDGAGNLTFDYVANLGIPSFIAYGYNGTFTGTGPIETTTVNGSTNDYGYRMPADGQVTHITTEIQYLINTSGTYDFIAEVYKNGAVTGQTGSVTISGGSGASNNTGFVKLLDSPVSFNSGDRLTIKMNFDAAGIQADDAALLLRVVTTN